MNNKEAEFTILKVAYLMTALDGHIDESERKMFDNLAARCREIDVDQAKIVLASVESATKRMLKEYEKAEKLSHQPAMLGIARGIGMALGGTKQLPVAVLAETAVLEVFEQEVDVMCDWAEFVRDSARVRKAFVMWMAMVTADGEYSGIEKKALESLRRRVNSYPLIGEEFLKSVEKETSVLQDLHRQIADASSLSKSKKFHELQDRAFARISTLVNG